MEGSMTRTLLTMTILGTVICLTGCMMQDTQGSPVATSEPTPVFGTSTPPFESGLTPTFAFTPTVPTTLPTAAEEISATPSFPLTESIDSLILSTGTSTTCALPCWHDLQIGVSTQSDIQAVLSQLLNIGGEYDFFPPPPGPGDLLLDRMRHVDGTDIGGYYWYTQAGERYGSYYLMSYIDENTGKLIGIQEFLIPFGSYELPSLIEVVDHLGTPDWVYGSRGGSTYTVVLFYAEGIRIAVGIRFIPRERNAEQDLVCLQIGRASCRERV